MKPTIYHLVRIIADVKTVFAALPTNDAIAGWFTETECSRWEAGSAVIWLGDIDLTIKEIDDNKSICFHVN